MTVARRPLLAGLAAGLVLVASGCGIPAEGTARAADPAAVPFGLIEAERDEARDPPAPQARRAEVYFVLDDDLVAVERALPSGGGARRAVAALLEGVTEDEAALGLRSALPPGDDTVAGVEVDRDTATVDLRPAFADIGSEGQALALAQMVFTATARPGIGRVAFTLEGVPVEVPRGDGTLTGEPLTRDDF